MALGDSGSNRPGFPRTGRMVSGPVISTQAVSSCVKWGHKLTQG